MDGYSVCVAHRRNDEMSHSKEAVLAVIITLCVWVMIGCTALTISVNLEVDIEMDIENEQPTEEVKQNKKPPLLFKRG